MRLYRLFIVVFCLISLLFISKITYSQSSKKILLAGKVLNSSTKEEIPFVHILINDSRLGVLTDDYGVYKISINTGDSLILNAIGYKGAKFIVPNISGDDLYQNIELDPMSYQLKEVCVYSLGTWEQFRQDFLHMKIEKTLEAKIAEKLNKNIAENIKRDLNSGAVFMTGSGIGVSFGKTPAQRTKARREHLARSIAQNKILARKYNKEIVAKIIGEKESETLDLFMVYINTNLKFTEKTSRIEIIKGIKELYNKFKLLQPEKEKIKRDTTA